MVYHIAVHESFDFYSTEYEQLFAASKATAFQSPLWLTHIYSDLVEQLGATPLIVSARCEQTDELKLVLPMVRSRYNGFSVIEPADFGICDYNAVIASPDVSRAFFEDDGLQARIKSVLKPYQLIFFFAKCKKNVSF